MTRKLTPYDTGERLEPRLWVTAERGDPRSTEDYGKVDYDDEESASILTTYVERNKDKSYTVHIDPLSDFQEIHVETDDDLGPLVISPPLVLQAKVKEAIDNLPTETERIESEVFWQNGQALILVGGETGYRKQQAIVVYANGLGPSSAIVKNWADGIRDTRIG